METVMPSAKPKARFQNGQIVLVSTNTQSNSTKLNLDARPYINQIGTVVGRQPRSMASPYYIVKFDDNNTVRVISLFLRGPFKTKEVAQKYQANPSMDIDSNDLG
ncbi:MAG: hypothetical protein ABFD50_15380 [Smithella sp.]